MEDRVGKEQRISDNVAELKAREKREFIASYLKMRLQELSPGYAKVVMKLVPDYQNFNGIIFGGIVMAVADQAFAYATNTITFPAPSIASQFNIHFIAAAELNDLFLYALN